QMVKDKYKITEIDVLEEIKSLRELVDDNKKSLNKLDLAKVEKSNKEVSTRIDSLYDILTKEFKARPFVDNNQDKIVQILS
ncbi:septation ring formation regulator EzrA, partial [Citrobacter sp. UMB8248A]|nr:septation ring formation regulator EzrA [Citrobacter sp. UMB8248A]